MGAELWNVVQQGRCAIFDVGARVKPGVASSIAGRIVSGWAEWRLRRPTLSREMNLDGEEANETAAIDTDQDRLSAIRGAAHLLAPCRERR